MTMVQESRTTLMSLFVLDGMQGKYRLKAVFVSKPNGLETTYFDLDLCIGSAQAG